MAALQVNNITSIIASPGIPEEFRIVAAKLF
jgi:hypothetical protein